MNPSLTTAQNLTLRNSINADSSFSSLPHNGDGAEVIAAAYNVVFSPDFWVWRTSVTKREIVGQASVDGTNFTWAGNGFITRSTGEISAWQELFDGGIMNPSLDNVRAAFVDVFSGTGNAASNRTHLAAVGRRKCTKVEKLFATGTGSTGSPGKMVSEGPLTAQDVMTAMGW